MDENLVKSELSHAFLHALAARNGYRYLTMPWVWDYAGIDAKIGASIRGSAAGASPYEVEIDVQLKATSRQAIPATGDQIPFSIPLTQYNALRRDRLVLLVLVVLLLPERPDEWLRRMDAGLTIGGAGYWVSLRGAPATDNKVEQTIYIPKSQELTPESFALLVEELAARKNANDPFFLYHAPSA